MSDDAPDPGGTDDPARDTTQTDDGRDPAGETGPDGTDDGNGLDETDGEAAEVGSTEETAVAVDVVDTAWRAAVETDSLAGWGDAEPTTDADIEPRTRVPTDQLFELLASPGNRFVLTYLLRVDDRAEYADLVEYVVAQTDPPEGLTAAKFRGRVAARLVTESLPALADAGLVDVDSTDQVVAATAATRVVAPHLALALSDLVDPVGPG